ncbi:MAG: helix-turn-helix transcriptional regulator [Acidobacteriota bacterium]|jgi:DNA-binding PadR family transcriptional regulator
MSDYLGEFEQMVLLSIMRLGENAYGLAVRGELEEVAGRKPSSGSLYTTLDRLEKKGLIESVAGESTLERGDRPRRYVRVTGAGKAQLARSRSTLLALWDGLERALDR